MENIIVDNIPPVGRDEDKEKIYFDRILALALNIGGGLLSCGASVSRVETAVERVCLAYDAEEVNVFALPSLVMCSIRLRDGGEVSQMKRIYGITNNFGKLEKFNQLSRDICSCKYEVSFAQKRFDEINASPCYKLPVIVAGGGVAAGAFAVFFGGKLIDSIPSLLIGMLMAYLNILLSRKEFNSYARTFILSALGGVLSIVFSRLLALCGANGNCSMVMTGTIMVVIPGLLVCNAVRDLFAGDIFSGTNELMNGLLTTLAIVAGYGASLFLLQGIVDFSQADPSNIEQRVGVERYIYLIVSCIIGSGGFSVMFNCSFKRLAVAMGNIVVTYAVYLVMELLLGTEQLFMNTLIATVFAAAVAEACARIFKGPSTIFLVPAIIVFVPGGSLYYTLYFLIFGNAEKAGSYGAAALMIFLGLAVGISIVTALFQLIYPVKGRLGINRWKNKKRK